MIHVESVPGPAMPPSELGRDGCKHALPGAEKWEGARGGVNASKSQTKTLFSLYRNALVDALLPSRTPTDMPWPRKLSVLPRSALLCHAWDP